MPHANSKIGFLPIIFLMLSISTVRPPGRRGHLKEDPIRIDGKDFFSRCFRREDRQIAALFHKALEDIALNTIVHDSNAEFALFLVPHVVDFLCRHLSHLIMPFRRGKELLDVFIRHIIRNDDA